jgi:predicted RecB family endonuclease
MSDTEQERDQLSRRLAEQELFRQALEEKRERVAELESEVKYLRRTLNDVLAAPRPQPAYAPMRTSVPRRWQAAA